MEEEEAEGKKGGGTGLALDEMGMRATWEEWLHVRPSSRFAGLNHRCCVSSLQR